MGSRKLMKKSACAACFLIFSLALAGCGKRGPEVAVTLHNDEIPQEIKNSIHDLNGKILKSIQAGYDEFVGDFFMAEVRGKKNFEQQLKEVCSRLQSVMKNREFEVFNEYYDTVKTARGPDPVVISAAKDKFVMRVKPQSQEIFISLLKTPGGGAQEHLFSLIFMKVHGQWQLYGLNLGVWAVGGKNALAWFEESRQLYDQGHLLPALFRLQLMQMCFKPAPFIQYENEQAIVEESNKMANDFHAKSPFPFSLKNIASVPEIFSGDPVFAKEEKRFTPLFQYVTKIPLDKADLLQQEARQMQEELKKLFPGLTQGVKCVAYRAFSESPKDAQKQYSFYGTIVDV